MQNFAQNDHVQPTKKFQKIYLLWDTIVQVTRHPEKKLLRHYLQTIEIITREGFFRFYPHRIAPHEYQSINKNLFPKLHLAYEDVGALEIVTGTHNQKMYVLPDSYPRSISHWEVEALEKNRLVLDRDELNYLLEQLSDNELRIYFALKNFNRHSNRGVETWYKNLRDSHVDISQTTLKKILNSLVEKGLISITIPLDKIARSKNRFIFYIKKVPIESVSTFLRPSFQEIDSKTDQFPENCAHLEKISESGFNLDQIDDAKKEVPAQKKEVPSDFNFYGLDTVNRPLNILTVYSIRKKSGLSIEQIQESVMRFSRYYFSDSKIQKSISNPIGLLRFHMEQNRQIYLEPEWWLKSFYHSKKLITPQISVQKKKENTVKQKTLRTETIAKEGKMANMQEISNCLKELMATI